MTSRNSCACAGGNRDVAVLWPPYVTAVVMGDVRRPSTCWCLRPRVGVQRMIIYSASLATVTDIRIGWSRRTEVLHLRLPVYIYGSIHEQR